MLHHDFFLYLPPVTVALAGFVAPMVFGFVAAHLLFGLSVLVSLFIGGTLTATSIGITVRVLADLDRQHSHEGQVILGAAVIDDVLGVLLLALLYEFVVGGGVSLVNASKVMLFILVFITFAPLLARLIAFVLERFSESSRIPGLIPASVVSLVLAFAWIANTLGAPKLLGGFAAGLALSRRFFLPFGAALHQTPHFARRVEHEIRPILHLFSPIFLSMSACR